MNRIKLQNEQGIFFNPHLYINRRTFLNNINHVIMRTLKFSIITFVFFSLSFLAHAQDKETRNVSSFNELRVGGSWDVVMQKGNKEEVRLEGKGIDLNKVITEVKNNSLHIYLEKGNYRNFDLKVYVVYKDLEKINKSGSGNLENKSDLAAENFELNLSGSGNTNLESVKAKSFKLRLSGSGNLFLSGGSVNELVIHQSGSGNIKSIDLSTENCKIAKSGSGNVEVTVNKSLEVASSGSGNVKYKGNPSINKVKFSGSGELVKN